MSLFAFYYGLIQLYLTLVNDPERFKGKINEDAQHTDFGLQS